MAGALGDVVGRLSEADLHLRVVVVDDGDDGLRGCAGAEVLGQVPEFNLQALAVVVHVVVLRGDHEALRGLAGHDGDTFRRVVVVLGRAVLVDHGDRDRHVAPDVRAQRQFDFNRAVLVNRVGVGAETDVHVFDQLKERPFALHPLDCWAYPLKVREANFQPII